MMRIKIKIKSGIQTGTISFYKYLKISEFDKLLKVKWKRVLKKRVVEKNSSYISPSIDNELKSVKKFRKQKSSEKNTYIKLNVTRKKVLDWMILFSKVLVLL